MARKLKLNGSLKSNILLVIALLVGCTSSNSPLPVPQKIGQNEPTRTISGNQAAKIINRMHRQSVAADANVIVEYGKDQKDILYISYYEDQNQANNAFNLMIEKMASAKKGPFFHLMPLPRYKKKSIFCSRNGCQPLYICFRKLFTVVSDLSILRRSTATPTIKVISSKIRKGRQPIRIDHLRP